MADKIRWGILGTGNIARQFARGLRELPDAELVAVGSRAQESADAFAAEFDVPRRHASYEALATDPGVDAIYIGTPHVFHMGNTLLCLDAGKAVLCEKPFAINAGQARWMVKRAREKGLFLMEAMWSRFLPALVRARELLAEGAIGDVQMLQADFGFRAELRPEHRLFNIQLGGGGLLDVGIYPVSLASMIFGAPNRIERMANIGVTGVDEVAAILLGYASGGIALLSTGVRVNTLHEATIIGTEGTIRLERPWWNGTRVTLIRQGKDAETFELPFPGNGYQFEAAAVGESLRAGKTEHAVMPLDETIQIMETLDAIRAPWGIQYPGD